MRHQRRGRDLVGRATPRGAQAPLERELERASTGLVYSSESDRPFEFFSVPYPGKRSSPSGVELARLVGTRDATPVEVRSVEDFFARHTTTSDPYDGEAQKLRPRYEELVRLLAQRLRDVKAYRIGKTEVSWYVVGLDAHGNLAGLKTTAVER